MKQENKQTKQPLTFKEQYQIFAKKHKLSENETKANLNVFDQAMAGGKRQTSLIKSLANNRDKLESIALKLASISYPFLIELGYTFQSGNSNNKEVNQVNNQITQMLYGWGLSVDQVSQLKRDCKSLKAMASKIKSDSNNPYDQVMKTLINNDKVKDNEIDPKASSKAFNQAVNTYLGNKEALTKKRTTNIATFDKFIDKKNDAHITDYVVNAVFNNFKKDISKLFKSKGYVIVDEKEYKSLTQQDPVEVTMNNVQHAINQ